MITQSTRTANNLVAWSAIITTLIASSLFSLPVRASTCSINTPICTTSAKGPAFKNPYYTKDIVPDWYQGATIRQLGIYAYGHYYFVTHKSLQPKPLDGALTFEQVTAGHNAQSKKALSFLLDNHPENYWFHQATDPKNSR